MIQGQCRVQYTGARFSKLAKARRLGSCWRSHRARMSPVGHALAPGALGKGSSKIFRCHGTFIAGSCWNPPAFPETFPKAKKTKMRLQEQNPEPHQNSSRWAGVCVCGSCCHCLSGFPCVCACYTRNRAKFLISKPQDLDPLWLTFLLGWQLGIRKFQGQTNGIFMWAHNLGSYVSYMRRCGPMIVSQWRRTASHPRIGRNTGHITRHQEKGFWVWGLRGSGSGEMSSTHLRRLGK